MKYLIFCEYHLFWRWHITCVERLCLIDGVYKIMNDVFVSILQGDAKQESAVNSAILFQVLSLYKKNPQHSSSFLRCWIKSDQGNSHSLMLLKSWLMKHWIFKFSRNLQKQWIFTQCLQYERQNRRPWNMWICVFRLVQYT